MRNSLVCVIFVSSAVYCASYTGEIDAVPQHSDYVVAQNIQNYAQVEIQHDKFNPDSNVIMKDRIYIDETQKMLDEAFERVSNQLSDNESASAKRAIIDTISLLQQIPLQYEPWGDITDEGIALMQWRTSKGGVILLFSGDGDVTVSIRDAHSNYSDSSKDYKVSDRTGLIISGAISAIYS
jgi:hypothetical protein